jgi:hypothetical protein
MKKLVLGLIALLSFTACNKNDFDYYNPQEAANAKFEAEFAKTFGKIDNTQTWGFDESIKVFDFTKATTRGHNVNGNLWYQQWERPVNVTDAEKTKVVSEFSKVREGATHTINLPWDNYWVQQVYQGTNYSVDGNGTHVFPSGVMNQLIAWNYNTNSYEHVNNFNNANNTTEYTDDVTHEKFIGTTLMINMGTGDVADQFGYHNTSDASYHYDYIVLEIDGAYYVGFDIVGYHPVGQDANVNMDVDRDWVFNDWIVKISPAMFNMEGAVRIIAEDLGASKSDFDYNDVVFDAKVANEWNGELNDNRLVAYIVLQAAGGTLPLTVGGKEVHEAFGVSTSTMVNTRRNTVSKAPVSFKVDLGAANWNINGADAVKSIPVIVQNGNNVIELEVKTGRAPEKIAVETRFIWCDEREPIYTRYTSFPNWVRDKSIVWY